MCALVTGVQTCALPISIMDLVHRVAGYEQPLGAGPLEPLRRRGHHLGQGVPLARRLKLGDRPEIVALDEQRRGDQPSLAATHALVDRLIIKDGRGPAPPADSTQPAPLHPHPPHPPRPPTPPQHTYHPPPPPP